METGLKPLSLLLGDALLLVIAGMVVFLSSAGADCKEAAAGKDSSAVWKIDYYPGQVSAASTVFLSPDALKICTEGSFEVSATAPAWTATVVNKKSKLSCDLPASKWMKEGFFMDPPDPNEYMNPRQAVVNELINFRGLAARRRTWKTMESDGFYRYRADPQKCTIELISTNDAIPVNKMQLAILSAWYAIPNLTGVPLSWHNFLPREKVMRLKVANIQQVPKASVSFQPRSGCKKETTMMKLVDNKFSEALTDFIELEEEIAPIRKKKNK